MARLRAVVTPTAEVALSAGTGKAVLYVRANTYAQLAVRGVSVSFDGGNVTAEPVKVDFVTWASTAETGITKTAVTPALEDGSGGTLRLTAACNVTAGEPSIQKTYRSYNVHPQTGAEWKFSIDEEFIVPVDAYFAIRCNAPAAVNVLAHIAVEE